MRKASWRRFLAMFLAFAMSGSLMPVNALAAEVEDMAAVEETQQDETTDAAAETVEEVVEEETETVDTETEEAAAQETAQEELDAATAVKKAKKAKVDIVAQMSGAMLMAPQKGVTVAADLAESYGYTDDIDPATAVSALDVLVKAHEIVFGDAFTAETATEYLTMGAYGPSMQFGVEGLYGGYFMNHGYSADESGMGYTVNTQVVVDNDLVEFFFYEDTMYGDTYNWFVSENGYSREFAAVAEKPLELTLKGYPAMYAYACPGESALVNYAGASAVEDAQVYLVDTASGTLTPVEGAVTGEDGKVSLTFAEAGTYTIAAYGTEDDCGAVQILSLTTVKVAPKPDPVEAKVEIVAQMYGALLMAPEKGVTVSSDLAESYGYTDGIDYAEAVSALDVLVKAHEIVLGDEFTPETAATYLTMGAYGPTMQFGAEGLYGGFFMNHGYSADEQGMGYLVTTQKVVDNDLVEFFFYEDPYYMDTYNWFVGENGYSREFAAEAGSALNLTLKGYMVVGAYECPGENAMVHSAGAAAVEDAQIYLVDTENGELSLVEGAVTDEDGNVSLTFAEAGTYTIAAYGTEDCMAVQILSLTTIIVGDKKMVGGKSEKLTLVNPATGKNYSAKELTWELDAAAAPYAVITAAGKLTTYKVQEAQTILVTATVKATGEKINTAITLYPAAAIVKIEKDEGAVTDTTINALPGDSILLTGVVYPSNAMQDVTWKSSSAKVATVDAEGRVTFLKAGTVTITAYAKENSKVSASVKFNVGVLVNEITVSNLPETLASGASVALKTAVNSDAAIKTVKWSLKKSSDSAFAGISASGKLTAKTVYEDKEIVLVASAADNSGFAKEFTVKILAKAQDVHIYNESSNVTKQTLYLDLNTTPEAIFTANTADVSWMTSNAKVAAIEVNEDGSVKVTGLKAGKAAITAKVGTKSTSVNLIVTGLSSSVTVGVKNNAEAIIASGKNLALTAEVDAKAANKKVIWSMAEGGEYASVNSKGVVIAAKNLVKVADVVVRATAADGNSYGEITVRVKPAATGIRIFKDGETTNTTMEVKPEEGNNTAQLSAIVYPRISETSVTWNTSSKSIATVDENGLVTFLKAGTVTITATANDGTGVKAVVKIKVVE